MSGPVLMKRIEIPRLWSSIELEGPVTLEKGVTLLLTQNRGATPRLIIRSGTCIDRYTTIDAVERIEIGADCAIGPHCCITDGNHGTAPGEPVRTQPMQTAPVKIGDGVSMGHSVVVLPGVRIGRGAVIGANSTVTRDIPDLAVAVGTPARVIGSRSDAASREILALPPECDR